MRLTDKTSFHQQYDKYLSWLAEQKEEKFLKVLYKTEAVAKQTIFSIWRRTIAPDCRSGHHATVYSAL